MRTQLPPLTRSRRALGACLLAWLTVAMPPCPLPASSEESPVGVVAMLLGTATVTRAALRAPALLRFKDGVFLRDRIVTGERSAVRVLLGGKATVTARERSSLTITEVPATSTVTLAVGRTAVAVSKAAMKPGQTIEIQTPNAVVAIRGTLVGRAATVAALNDVTQPLIGNGGTTSAIGNAVLGPTGDPTATSSVNAVGSLGSSVLTGATAPIGGVIPTTPTDPTTLTGPTP